MTRRPSGPRPRYTSLAVKLRLCAAAAAQRPTRYVPMALTPEQADAIRYLAEDEWGGTGPTERFL